MSRWSRPVALAVLALGLTACSEEKDRAAEAELVRPVLSVVVEPHTANSSSFAGTIDSRYTTDLSFRVLGRITSRTVDVGDAVKKAETLATVDATALALAVQSAKADYASAQAQLVNANANDARLGKLAATGSIAQADYESAHEAALSAKANAEREKSALDKAHEQLSYANLSSDFDAVVTAVSADVGQTVSPGQTVISVARPDQGEAVVDIPDSLIGNFKVGDSFEVRLQALPSVAVTGNLREIAPQSDSATRTRRVKISLVKAPMAFRLGATITARPQVQTEGAIQLPLSSLLETDGKTEVWVVDEAAGTVARRAIVVGDRDAASFVVASGLTSGDRVVTAGVHSLKDGQKIKLERAAS